MRRKKKRQAGALGHRRAKMFRIKMVLLGLVIISIIAIFAWLLRLKDVVIYDVVITGNSITKTEEIKDIVDEHLHGSYLYVIPKNSEFFLPKRAIKTDIENTFTRIKSVEVTVLGGDAISINVEERRPYALWCGDSYINTEENLGNCYFIDDSSYVFAKAPDFTGNIFFKYFGILLGEETTTSTAPLGKEFMSKAEFDAISVFLEAFEEIEYIPVSFTRVQDGDFSVRMESGVEILYGHNTRLSVVLDNLESIIVSDLFIDLEQEQIEYIDLRFGSKVYYKLHGKDAVGK